MQKVELKQLRPRYLVYDISRDNLSQDCAESIIDVFQECYVHLGPRGNLSIGHGQRKATKRRDFVPKKNLIKLVFTSHDTCLWLLKGVSFHCEICFIIRA